MDLRKRFDKQISRQSFSIFAFDNSRVPGRSIRAIGLHLFEQTLAWLQAQHQTHRSSFSVWVKLSAMPWWTGQYCTCLYVGGRAETQPLVNELMSWDSFVEAETDDPCYEDAVLLCHFDPQTATLHLSTPIVAVFVPYATNLAQDDEGEWIWAGERTSVDGEWLADHSALSSAGRVYQGTEDMVQFLSQSVDLHLVKMPPSDIHKLETVRDRLEIGPALVHDILRHSKSVEDIERSLAQVETAYGQNTPLW